MPRFGAPPWRHQSQFLLPRTRPSLELLSPTGQLLLMFSLMAGPALSALTMETPRVWLRVKALEMPSSGR